MSRERAIGPHSTALERFDAERARASREKDARRNEAFGAHGARTTPQRGAPPSAKSLEHRAPAPTTRDERDRRGASTAQTPARTPNTAARTTHGAAPARTTHDAAPARTKPASARSAHAPERRDVARPTTAAARASEAPRVEPRTERARGDRDAGTRSSRSIAPIAPARRHDVPSGDGTFADLGLMPKLLDAVGAQGYETPTPIQVAAIPHVLKGKDLLGCARTGTGKTASFALPMLQLLSQSGPHAGPRQVRALVVVPTRELASQVAESFKNYGAGLGMSVAVIFGGVPQGAQVKNLERGLDVLVATPGRLVDLMGQRHAKLDKVGILVLDEADHMLDLGFLPDVKRILQALPKKRQTLFFSATMPPAIAQLADGILVQPEKVYVTPAATTAEAVEQSVHFVDRGGKPELLRKILSGSDVGRSLVFTRTKRGSDKVAKRLTLDGVPAQAIHGNKSQGNRERTLASFRDGSTRVLVATDIAARGIDVDGITHVVNYELPNVPETYVHRIGRTARAGATGVAIAFCDYEEREYLRDIEKLIKKSIPVASGSAASLRYEPPEARERGRRGQQGGGRSGRTSERASPGGGRGKFANSRHGGGGGGSRGAPRGGAPRAPARMPTVQRSGAKPAAARTDQGRASAGFGTGV